jgi:hypothetical protein
MAGESGNGESRDSLQIPSSERERAVELPLIISPPAGVGVLRVRRLFHRGIPFDIPSRSERA